MPLMDCAQICAHPTPKSVCFGVTGLQLKVANRARIYCSNSRRRRQCENASMKLLTGGLLVRIQPEEPIPSLRSVIGSPGCLRGSAAPRSARRSGSESSRVDVPTKPRELATVSARRSLGEGGPEEPIFTGSIPETWVTLHSGHIGNTLALHTARTPTGWPSDVRAQRR